MLRLHHDMRIFSVLSDEGPRLAAVRAGAASFEEAGGEVRLFAGRTGEDGVVAERVEQAVSDFLGHVAFSTALIARRAEFQSCILRLLILLRLPAACCAIERHCHIWQEKAASMPRADSLTV